MVSGYTPPSQSVPALPGMPHFLLSTAHRQPPSHQPEAAQPLPCRPEQASVADPKAQSSSAVRRW